MYSPVLDRPWPSAMFDGTDTEARRSWLLSPKFFAVGQLVAKTVYLCDELHAFSPDLEVAVAGHRGRHSDNRLS